MLLNVPEIGISSHFRIYLLMTGSTFSIIHVFDRDATVKCHDIWIEHTDYTEQVCFLDVKVLGRYRTLVHLQAKLFLVCVLHWTY